MHETCPLPSYRLLWSAFKLNACMASCSFAVCSTPTCVTILLHCLAWPLVLNRSAWPCCLSVLLLNCYNRTCSIDLQQVQQRRKTVLRKLRSARRHKGPTQEIVKTAQHQPFHYQMEQDNPYLSTSHGHQRHPPPKRHSSLRIIPLAHEGVPLSPIAEGKEQGVANDLSHSNPAYKRQFTSQSVLTRISSWASHHPEQHSDSEDDSAASTVSEDEQAYPVVKPSQLHPNGLKFMKGPSFAFVRSSSATRTSQNGGRISQNGGRTSQNGGYILQDGGDVHCPDGLAPAGIDRTGEGGSDCAGRLVSRQCFDVSYLCGLECHLSPPVDISSEPIFMPVLLACTHREFLVEAASHKE